MYVKKYDHFCNPGWTLNPEIPMYQYFLFPIYLLKIVLKIIRVSSYYAILHIKL